MKTSFKAWWNGLWYNRPPEDDFTEWLIDVFGFLPIQIGFFVIVMAGFCFYLWWIDRDFQKLQRKLKEEREEDHE